MDKSYCDFVDEISAEELYEGLLGYGMFSDKLPPIFTSEKFLVFFQTVAPVFSDNKWHDFVSYSAMRSINVPRLFGIPTPMKYERLCAVLRDNWDDIKTHFHNQTDNQAYRVSRIHLRKMNDSKLLFEMNYKNWRVDGNPETDLLLNNYHASKFVVKADVSTCFPSIYTHALPWAFVGKDEAKASCKDDSLWFNRIDAACSNMKNGETHGLLIGPHASNLLAEVILTCVDKRLYDDGYRFFRCVDDFECYVESFEKSQAFLRDLEDALREFDLPLNHKKTIVKQLPVAITENWIHKLNGSLQISNEVSYPILNSYLDLALGIANETGDSAVLKYAIKTLSGCMMTDNAKKCGAQRILHLAVVFPYLLHLMEEFVFQPFNVSLQQIKVFADTIYKEAYAIHNYEAISYAVYYSLKYDFDLERLDIGWVIEREDCILLLMTWLYYLKANHGNTGATELKPLKDEAKRLSKIDMNRYWLFCYEALSVGLLSGDWKVLKQAGVSFVKTVF